MTAYIHYTERKQLEELESQLQSKNELIALLHKRIEFYDETLDSIRVFVNAYHALEDTGEDGVCPTMINAIEHVLDMVGKYVPQPNQS